MSTPASPLRSSYIGSFNTRSASLLGQETDYALANTELVKSVNDMRHEIHLLKLENEILENSIMRLEPALINGVYQALEYATKINSVSSLNVGSFIKSVSKFGLTENSRMTSSPSRLSTRKVDSAAKLASTVISGTGPRINVLERSELVSTEMEMQVLGLKKANDKAAKSHALLKAELEEIGMRLTDIDKAGKFFKQEVLIEGWDKIAQRIPAEIWIRFMTEWMKLSDSQIGKLRLRTSTLNTHFSKLKSQIKVKAELSESLRPVDFEKLKIENDECLKVIDQKIVQLGELKKMTGDANLNLAIHKKAMMTQNNYLSKVLSTIKNKTKQTVQLDKESDLIQVQVDLLAQRLNEIRKLRLAYKVPNVMEYVEVKWEMTDLKHAIKMLENRVHIQQIALTSVNKKLHTLVINAKKKESAMQ